MESELKNGLSAEEGVLHPSILLLFQSYFTLGTNLNVLGELLPPNLPQSLPLGHFLNFLHWLYLSGNV